MEPGSIERRARLLFAATLAIIAAGFVAWYLWSAGHYITYQLITHDAISGLAPDQPVEFHGVTVGKVTRVELMDPRTIRILLQVEKSAPVSVATRATVVSRGLSPKGFTGYVSIALEDTGSDTRRLVAAPGEPFPTIPVVAARDISLDSEISQANELIHAVLDQATLQSLKQSVESVRQISATLAENNARLTSLIANSERASRQLEPLLRSSGDSIDALQQQVLPQAYRALSDLENLTRTLNGTAADIARDPSVLLRGRARPAPAPGEKQ